jgi:hypothetical protein
LGSATKYVRDCAASVVALGFSMSSAWAQPAADEWRYENVQRIVSVSALPFYVDTHCLPPSFSAAPESSQVIVLRFRVGRAPYHQAFPVTPELDWHVGDRAAFVPRTCDIKRASP